MTIRFFILMAHYRSTVDFSNEALIAAEKGLARLTEAYERLQKLQPSAQTTVELGHMRQQCQEAMDDDLNTPIVISHLFDSARVINTVFDGKGIIAQKDLDELRAVWKDYAVDILGLRLDNTVESSADWQALHGAVDLLLTMRLDAKRNKDWVTSDKIRDNLTALGFRIKDTKDSFEWSL